MTRTTCTKTRAARTQRAPRRDLRRRGSVIILVVAVLAVLAIFAASYVTVTRLERASSVAYAQRSNFIQQRDAVVSHLQALLAADMFGNKVVTGNTPRSYQAKAIWPVMFEDGGWWDAPYVVSNPGEADFTFNVNPPDQQPSTNSLLTYDTTLRAYQTTYPDKAWLASTQPVSATNNPAEWSIWPQITNLRSAYNWDPRADGGQGAWVRDHGRFLDLANFFRSERANRERRGDPGADLSDLSSDPDFTGGWNPDNAVRAGVLQAVYDKQMNHMQAWAAANGSLNPDDLSPGDANFAYEQSDLRMWVDTDGDGRADARWQELDALGFALGLRWVVATRITDASAMLNVNASLEAGNFNDPSQINTVASGITPADVDLFRLLDTSARSGNAAFRSHPDLMAFNLARSVAPFMEHLTRGLNLGPREGDNTAIIPRPFVFSELHQLITDPTTDIDASTPNRFKRWNEQVNRRSDTPQGWQGATDNWTNAILPGVRTFTTRAQREAYYRFVGVSPQASALRFASPYPITDEIDLRAHFGFNYGSSVSKLEQRLDGPADPNYNVSRLPGSIPDYPVRGSLGFLRSKEDMQAARGLGATNATLPGLTGTYDQQQKIARIEADVRRLLTTYSGVGYRSPVSPKRRDTQTGALTGPDSLGKVMLTGAPWASFGGGAEAFVRRSFESFAWALAPLAGNQPLLRGLQQAPGQFSYLDHDFHYGGGQSAGVDGPARRVALASGNVNMNASYAILRSLALAINLKDATDFEGDPLGETPTVVRFHNLPERDLEPIRTAALASGDNTMRLGPNFAHGDVEQTFLPQEYVGQPEAGVTMIGMERQPFLREVAVFSFYQDSEWVSGVPNPQIEATDPADQLGCIIAIEIGNPWHEDVYLDNYTFRLAAGTEVLDLDLDGPLAPGQSQILYFQQGDSAEWTNAVIGWLQELTASSAFFEPPREILTGTPGLADPVFLVPFDGQEAQAMLLFNDFASPTTPRYIVDRMSPAPGDTFPTVLPSDNPFTIPDPDPVDPAFWTGRIAVVSSLRRPTEPPPAGGGFPAYVVERPIANGVGMVDESDLQQIFKVNAPEDPITLGEESVVIPISFTEIYLGEEDKGSVVGLAPFQLFVPDGPLLTTSELHMLCKFAHMYVHPDANIYDVNALNNLDRWTTIGEQLGMDAHYFYDGTGAPNPYLGVLDPSRFILGQLGDLNAVPMAGGSPAFERVANMLAVPLAVRVFDAFDALPSPTTLAQGRININTAPERVLRVLPMVDPRDPVTGYNAAPPNIGPWSPNPFGGDRRVEMISAYRNDYTRGPNVGDTPQAITNLQGLRGGLLGATGLNNRDHQGLFPFVSTGELAVLGRWDPTGNAMIDATFPGFLELGESGSPGLDTEPLDLRTRYADPMYNPRNDPEERLALFRAISNIVSTRSDVFVMWFVLRGYDPAAIESIGVPGTPTEDELGGYLNNLAPAYESRWLCVLDRSGVRTPTDRPRVILLVELPSTSP